MKKSILILIMSLFAIGSSGQVTRHYDYLVIGKKGVAMYISQGDTVISDSSETIKQLIDIRYKSGQNIALMKLRFDSLAREYNKLIISYRDIASKIDDSIYLSSDTRINQYYPAKPMATLRNDTLWVHGKLDKDIRYNHFQLRYITIKGKVYRYKIAFQDPSMFWSEYNGRKNKKEILIY